MLAERVRQRLRVYLDHRARRWPATANPYLFLHQRNALRTRPTRPDWISLRLAGMAQNMREDRILDELLATGGDLRRLCDLFGLSISGAERYLDTRNHPDLDPADHTTDQPSSNPIDTISSSLIDWNVRARRLVRILRQRGCEPVRQRGSHQIWRCANCQTVIPLHIGDIPTGTPRSIERDLEPCLGPRWLTP